MQAVIARVCCVFVIMWRECDAVEQMKLELCDAGRVIHNRMWTQFSVEKKVLQGQRNQRENMRT